MEVEFMKLKVKPYKGKWCGRNMANQINDMLLSAPKPDRTQLRKDANEFRKLILKRRADARKKNESVKIN